MKTLSASNFSFMLTKCYCFLFYILLSLFGIIYLLFVFCYPFCFGLGWYFDTTVVKLTSHWQTLKMDNLVSGRPQEMHLTVPGLVAMQGSGEEEELQKCCWIRNQYLLLKNTKMKGIIGFFKNNNKTTWSCFLKIVVRVQHLFFFLCFEGRTLWGENSFL